MITISNEQLTVVIHEKGAELQSIKLNGLEYLWQANPGFWGKYSPVLFPIIGELKNGKYFFNEKEYHLPRHGFARDKIFEPRKIDEANVIFTLQSDKETLQVYPFPFIFRLQYAVKGRQLFCTYIVENSGADEMYFSAGGHPAFKVPLIETLEYMDYALKFTKDEYLQRFLLHNGLTGEDAETIPLDDHILRLHPSLFYDDAIVLKTLASKEITLFSIKDPHSLTFHFEGFPYFGIWASKDAPFICLEPWCGIADNIHHRGELIHKEGINSLSAGDIWQRTWSVELF